MKMLLDGSGRCIGLGDIPSAQYVAPNWITFADYNTWVCNNLSAINDPASWEQNEPPVNTTTDPFEIVKRDIVKGKQMILRFLAENKTVGGINVENSLTQLAAFQNAKMALEVGDLGSAQYLISLISNECFVVCAAYSTSEERKQSYIEEITNYRANNS